MFFASLNQRIKRSERVNPLKKLPPSPWKLPLIGNLHNLMGTLPHHTLRDLSTIYGPLMHLQLGEVSAVVISSPRLAKEIMKTRDLTFAHRPKIQTIWSISYEGLDFAFAPYDEYWKQMRKICVQEVLSTKKVTHFGSIRQEEFSNLIDSIHFHGSKVAINLTKKISLSTSAMVNRTAFGNSCKDHETFSSLVKEIFSAAGGFSLQDLYPSWKILGVLNGTNHKLLRLRQKMDLILDDIINDHVIKKNMGTKKEMNREEDLIDVFLRVRDSGDIRIPITNNHIKAVLFVSISVVSLLHKPSPTS